MLPFNFASSTTILACLGLLASSVGLSVAVSIQTPALDSLTPAKLASVRTNALAISTHSWELGTLTEALTELEWPSLAVFAPHSIPPPSHLSSWDNAGDVIKIATEVVRNKTADTLPLIDGDGAVGDPASLGFSVLLANWTRTNKSDTVFSVDAQEQLEYLLTDAPRSPQGAISHRESQVQLWADFVYMAPPFIAYYGALEGGSGGQALLQTAYDQARLYRDVLYDADVSLWRHIALGDGTDPTHWATGNAWAAAGMLRVLATIRQSDFAEKMLPQQKNLTIWVNEIFTGAWSRQQTNGTLLNYLDQPSSFADSSSTALMAAATFRYTTLTGDFSHVPAAVRARQLIHESVDADGWLLNTVDPEVFSAPSQPGQHSPEGQSFVLLLEAAWTAFQAL
ncbi:Six-hairpin glycosidase [Artomyces pyxidatus]|uniref:Six-hairpin glycosidase n=1 Tax=Artomyces pyxidatus TaxID=48021 RepID=A0ACB8TL62_9AGAM|nr:Six-hairpin glycosidase [Artomyces pyxidatus]